MVGRYGLDAFSKWYSMVKNAYKYRSTDDDEDGGQNEGTILMDNSFCEKNNFETLTFNF